MRKRVLATGRVQGVFFRDTVQRAAEREGVAGWVRNTREGTLEAVFEGDGPAVERLVELCGQGPPGARVERLDVSEELEEGLEGFRVR